MILFTRPTLAGQPENVRATPDHAIHGKHCMIRSPARFLSLIQFFERRPISHIEFA